MQSVDLPPPIASDLGPSEPGFAKPGMVGICALIVGLTIDTLALHQPPGLGLALGLVVGLVVAAGARWLMGERLAVGTVPVLACGVLMAGFVAVRTSPVMLSLDIGGAAAAIILLTQVGKAPGWGGWSIYDYGLQPFSALGDFAGGGRRFVGGDLRAALGDVDSSRLGAVGAGVLIGLPLVFIFGALFVSADVVFGDYVHRLVDGILFGSVFWRAALSVGLGFAVAGLWRSVRSPRPVERLIPERERLDVTTGVTILGLLVTLFLFFLVTQVIDRSPALEQIADYSENARQGFFQLATVAFLVLNLLLVLDYAIRGDDGGRSVAFDRLAVVLVGLTAIVMVSALQRMRLYVVEFGFTELRFYSTVFMLWLAFVLVWFTRTVLRNRRARFALGLIVSGFVVIMALNVANPDALIVRLNWARHQSGANFSDRYNADLSVDTLTTLIAIRGESAEEWCFIDKRLRREQQELATYRAEHGVLAESWAAWRARTALAELDLAYVDSVSCVDPRTTRRAGG